MPDRLELKSLFQSDRRARSSSAGSPRQDQDSSESRAITPGMGAPTPGFRAGGSECRRDVVRGSPDTGPMSAAGTTGWTATGG